MNRVPLITAALVIFCGSAGGQPVTTSQTVLTLAGAKQVIAAAVTEADRLKAPGGSIAVVDAGGHLIALERLDNTFAASADIAVGKARTAVLFKKPTRVFEDLVNGGRTTMVTLPDFTPLQGGVPVVVDGQVVGAVGVSGAASAQQDEDIANAAARFDATVR
jgi:glc operon protein GlcG